MKRTNTGDVESDGCQLLALSLAPAPAVGSVSGLLKGMGAMSPDQRREQGPMINGLRDRVSAAITARKAELEAAELDARLQAERIDLTLPARPRRKGGVHPTMQVMDEMVSIFAEMGFSVAEGPDIETDFNNFTAASLNVTTDRRSDAICNVHTNTKYGMG